MLGVAGAQDVEKPFCIDNSLILQTEIQVDSFHLLLDFLKDPALERRSGAWSWIQVLMLGHIELPGLHLGHVDPSVDCAFIRSQVSVVPDQGIVLAPLVPDLGLGLLQTDNLCGFFLFFLLLHLILINYKMPQIDSS